MGGSQGAALTVQHQSTGSSDSRPVRRYIGLHHFMHAALLCITLRSGLQSCRYIPPAGTYHLPVYRLHSSQAIMSKHIGADCCLLSSSKLAKQAAQGGSSPQSKAPQQHALQQPHDVQAPKQQSAEDSVSSTASCSQKSHRPGIHAHASEGGTGRVIQDVLVHTEMSVHLDALRGFQSLTQ